MGRRIAWFTLFALAMGLLESTVVVYLRALFYPDGFGFPVRLIEGNLAHVELLREATTLVMLLAVAVLAGRDRLDRTLAEWIVATAGGIVVIVSFCWHWRVVVQGLVPAAR